MWNKRVLLTVLLIILLLTTNGLALRIPRPPILSYPMTQDQVSDLNKFITALPNILEGRYEADIVTTSKTSANNGEFWMIQTGVNVCIQYKANNKIYTITGTYPSCK